MMAWRHVLRGVAVAASLAGCGGATWADAASTSTSASVFNLASYEQVTTAMSNSSTSNAMRQTLSDAGLTDDQITEISTGDAQTEGAVINNAVINHVSGSAGFDYSGALTQTDKNGNAITNSSLTAAYLAGGNTGVQEYASNSCTATCSANDQDSMNAANAAAASSSQASAGMTSSGGFDTSAFTGGQGGCMYTTPYSSDTTVLAGENAIIGLICQIHLTGYGLISSMTAATAGSPSSGDNTSTVVSFLTSALSLAAAAMFTYALVIVTLQCFEVIIRLAIYAAFFPFIAFCFVFRATRPIFDTMVRGFIYAAMHFAFLGLFLAAGLMIMKQGITAVAAFSSLSGTALTTSTGIAQAVAYCATAIATGLMTSKVMGASASAAAAMSNYAWGNVGAASGAMAMASQGVSMARTGAIVGVGLLGRMGGMGGIAGARGMRRAGAHAGIDPALGRRVKGLMTSPRVWGGASAIAMGVGVAYLKGGDVKAAIGDGLKKFDGEPPVP